jgi:thiol-disulfide isomerase/thioredoxin
LRERPVVLVFYPADWSPVCGDQLTLYSALRSEWDRLGAEVIAISVDGPWCHAAYREARNLRLTLLADFEPKGDVSRTYGVYDQGAGTSKRALKHQDLARYADQAGVKGDVVLTDLAEARYRELVRESFMNGVRSGVNGTPTLFIDGIRYDGPRDEETLVAVLRRVADQAGVGGRA